MCPKHAIEFDTEFMDLLLNHMGVSDLDSYGDNPNDPTIPPEEPNTVAGPFT